MALPSSFTAALITVLLFPALFAVKRLYFHPLSRYNGPLLWAVTRVPYMLAFRNGQLAHKIKHFHEVYGETVRVAPNEVSFINPDTVKDIYQRRPRGGGFKSLPKDPIRQAPPRPGQPMSILDAGDADHTRLRKAYAAAFSGQALTAQEPLVTSYVDKMITQLRSQTQDATQSIDIQEWVSFCTFDIVCKLSFGEDFGCLDNQRYHEWVGQLVYSLKAKVQLASCRFYPWLFNYLVKRLPKSAGILMAQHQATTQEKVKRRLQQLHSGGSSNTAAIPAGDLRSEMVVNAATLIVAGSHTLQTAITGILFHLLQHPTVLDRVTSEVWGAFPSANQMSVQALLRLPLLEAAIKEGIRLTSPVPLGLTRLVPIGGHMINGEFFAEGTVVSYMQWAANVSPQNYTDPIGFHLERWLKSPSSPSQSSTSSIDDHFGRDRKHATQPFLQGPRDCIGQNLARMEIVLILGKLLYHFDLQAEGKLGRWEDQETYAVWVKTPLPVRLRVRDGLI
ncbi:benzoate 4-monooxygenase cytochrome P450 [Aspergillus nomiae NRRL 13137]|uniref:Benzoate 4-monooxygenase cytochrome P450 n=1 Tax=Aspergillus nomiae NRRL (strain ATCC 15546 / NRRL 13137 / CBS 260.88 / M93) TaxID=1509407 RepID=A0A0L1JGW8_ASPN3|nr:benzoate 4-monooxygenase cytochrome P450 [Aspergillus nomiae NRRL 13137]KNG90648.1 benzoate 4-monooxygenase cytochrome P450 [Aspergillus nomiae NRRL 13137]